MLYIDNRIGSKELYITLRRLGLQCEVVDLKKGQSAADFEFAGNGPDGPVLVGVEKKKLNEMLNAVDTKRWAGQQLIGLLDNYHYVVLVVEGTWRAGEDSALEMYRQKGETVKDGTPMGWAMWVRPNRGRRLTLYSELDNLTTSLSLQCGVVVKPTADERSTCHAVRDIYNWFQKEWDEHRSFKQVYAPVSGPVKLTRPCLTWRMAAQVDGIDYELGKRIRSQFNTPLEMHMGKGFKATQEQVRRLVTEWAEVKGISKERARKIVRMLGHNPGGDSDA